MGNKVDPHPYLLGNRLSPNRRGGAVRWGGESGGCEESGGYEGGEHFDFVFGFVCMY